VWHKFLLFLTRHFIRRQLHCRPPQPWSDLKVDTVKRVLLINSTALGDLLFSTPAIRALKEYFPAWELDILVQPGLRPLLQHDPHIRHSWIFPGRGLRLLRLARQLRQRNYNLVIILHGNDPEASLLAWLSGSPYIIGSSKSPFSFAYSYGVSSGGPYEHAIEKRLNFVRPLGVKVTDTRMTIFLPEDVKKQADEILAKHFGSRPTMLAALHPGGSASYKHWPPDNFVALGKFLQQTYNAKFLFISTAAERNLSQQLAAQIEAPALVTGGQYNLLTVAALLSRCHLFVGNDSGPLHLAIALQIPSIGILGADDPQRIGPYQVEWGSFAFRKGACLRNPCLTKRCRQPHCLEAILPREVSQLIQEWWEPKFMPLNAAEGGLQNKNANF
jgi:ADP-heptose:LPS heptosyltransferase